MVDVIKDMAERQRLQQIAKSSAQQIAERQANLKKLSSQTVLRNTTPLERKRLLSDISNELSILQSRQLEAQRLANLQTEQEFNLAQQSEIARLEAQARAQYQKDWDVARRLSLKGYDYRQATGNVRAIMRAHAEDFLAVEMNKQLMKGQKLTATKPQPANMLLTSGTTAWAEAPKFSPKPSTNATTIRTIPATKSFPYTINWLGSMANSKTKKAVSFWK